jgi:hypothetical protein
MPNKARHATPTTLRLRLHSVAAHAGGVSQFGGSGLSADHKPIELDFTKKETEAGWQAIIDNAALRLAPLWFSWLGWVLALSAIAYLKDRSGSLVLQGIFLFSVGVLWFYFQAYFARLSFRNWPGLGRERVARLFSIIMSACLAVAAWWRAIEAASIIAANQTGSG